MNRRGLALLPVAISLFALARPQAGLGATGQAFVPITACRSVDTRGTTGPNGGPALAANEVRLLTIAGTCTVPSNALALAVNLTVVRPAAIGYAQLYAGDAGAPPATSVLSFTPNKTRAGFALVALASNGSGVVALANGSSGPADFIVDVLGYFIPACTSAITVSNPSTTAATVNAAFAQTFTSSGGTGPKTFATASTLPSGLTLAANGTLSGTPTQPGTFPVVVTATDANGCTGTGSTYTLVISCQAIAVTNPAVTTGTANAAFSQTFTQTGGVGATTFSTSSALPIGLTLAANGVLSGTPTQAGGFPITVKATDANGCVGTGPTYNLVINCQTITVTNPATAAGTAGQAFSQTFTQSGAIGPATFSTSSALPAGLALSAAGVLSGTPTVTGSFPIVVKVTDGNLCTGTGSTYNLAIGCPTIVVTNPATATATAGAAFSQTFTQSGAVGSATFSTSSALPSGLTLSAAGVLSGTPTVTGSFPITVRVTDANGCIGTGTTYTLVVSCQTYSVGPATLPQATTGVTYPSVTFTQTGGIGSVTFSQTGTLPAGMSFALGVLSGTPTQTGSFPITVTATDANNCTASRDYLLVVACSGTSITLSPSSLPSVAAGSAFPSTTFTATGGAGPYSFQKSGVLPVGMSFTTDTLSGTPTQTGTFPITISATDSGGCAGSQDYVVTVTCSGVTITVAPPSVAPGPVGTAYGPVTFTASGGTSPYAFAKTGALPPGITFSGGVLSGTPTVPGTFPFTVTATDAAGCVGATSYSLVTTCPTITVTNPSTATGTVDAAFSQTFTQSGGAGSVTFSTASTLPSGLTLSSAGVLSGTPGKNGTFPIVVKVTDANGCTGTGATYNLVISCQTITVTNPSTATGTVDAAFSQTFTQTGGGTHTPVTFATSSTLPSGLSLSSAGVLSGTPGQNGTFPITVTATDANGCSGTGSTYSLAISCQTITVTNASATTSTYNTALSPAANYTFTQTGVGAHTPATFTVASGTLPTGVSLTSAGVLTGTPTQTGTFTFTVKATDANGCFGTGASYTLTVAPVAVTDSYSGLVDNTQFVITGGSTASPLTPFVGSTGRLTSNDLPSGGVTVTTTGTFATAAGGSVTIAADGTFVYTPKANPTLPAVTSDSFNYAISSNTGGTPTATTANGTVNLTLAGRVWYVKNTGLGGNGQSQSTFNLLSSAIAASTANDSIFVYRGDGTTTNLATASTLKTGQKLIGEGVALVVNSKTLVPAGSFPLIGNTLTLANSVTVDGIDMSTGSSRAITNFNGASYSTVTGVSVTARNVASTTGTAIDIQGTGNTGTMAFTSVSANGGANGIVLQNFTGGTFTILGTGTAGSGGTIQNMTGTDGAVAGSGIYLNGTSSVSLAWMDIEGCQNYGIRGFTVNGFTLTSSTVGTTAVNGTSATADVDAGTLFSGEGSVRFNELTGTVSVLNSVLDGGFSRTMAVHNTSGTMNLTIDNSTLRDTSTNASTTDAFFMQSSNAAVMNLTIQNNSLFTAYRQNAIQTDARDTSTMSITISNSAFSNSNAALINAGGSLSLGSSASTDTLVQFNIHDNTFRHGLAGSNSAPSNGGAHLVCGTISGAGKFDGKFVNNTVGVSGVAFSGAGNAADALRVFASGNRAGTTRVTGTTDSRFLIQGNTIKRYGEVGIQINARQGNSVLDATLFGNTINEPGSIAGGAFGALWVNAGALPGDTNTVNVAIGDAVVAANKNTMQDSDPNNFSDVFLENDSAAGAILNLYKNGSGSAVDRQVILDDNNPTLDLDVSGGWKSGTINLVSGVPPTPP